MTSTAIVIPARIDSTRLPGKMLLPLNGVPLVKHVYNKCQGAGFDTFVLTDSRRVAHLFPYSNVVYTGDADNGTDRCCQALEDKKLDKYDRLINVQGDMPDVTLDMIEKCAWHLQHYSITTVFTDLPEDKQNDPNTVKMIRAGDKSLWFGRGMTGYGDWHLGVYGYRRNALQMYSSLAIPLEEEVEKLEQIRWLKAGWDIGCLKVNFNGVEINTQHDLDQWNTKWKEQQT